MSKIEMGRVYRTRDGREVRIYAVDGEGHYSVHGAIKWEGAWVPKCWTANGGYLSAHCETDPFDLIEVKPRIQREVWVNVYPGPIVCELRHSKADADEDAMRNRIACVKLVIDCEEGHGLD